MLSDEAQEDLARALRFHARDFPRLRHLRPATGCVDVVFAPEEVDDLGADVITLLERSPNAKRKVTSRLRTELATLQELMAKATDQSLFISAHLE